MPKPGQLSFARTQTGYCLRVEGRGTSAQSGSAAAFVAEALGQPDKVVVLDLSHAEYLDSTFLGCLVGMHRKYRDGRFKVAAAREVVPTLFGSSRLEMVLHVTEEVPPAVGEYVAIPPQSLTAREMARHIMECHQRLAEIPGPQQKVFATIAQQMEQEFGNSK